MMSNEFEKALDAFLEGADADEAHQALYVQLGENVRKLRKRCHLTQDELAARIGADQKRVSKIERGEARPNLTLCLRLANAFHVSVDTLLEGVVEYEMVQTLLNATSEQLLAQELLQVVKRYIR